MARTEELRVLDEGGDPFHANTLVTLYVHAGIAASDAICCQELGEHSEGRNHAEAIGVLRQVTFKGDELAKSLSVLLALKTDAGYGSRPLPPGQALRARRSAEKLVLAARERVSG